MASIPPIEVTLNMAYGEIPEVDTLEKAFTYIQKLSDKERANLYKALYLNDMRIDKAESVLSRKDS